MSEPQMRETQTGKIQTSKVQTGDVKSGDVKTGEGQGSATWASATFPAVPPDARFRAELQRALEQTHRQQAAQRKIGAQPVRPRRQGQGLRFLAAMLILAIIGGISLYTIFRPKPASGASRP